MTDAPDSPHHRASDQTATARITGLSMQQLAVQFVGALLLAAVVGLLSSWATQQVMSEQLSALSRQLDEVRSDLRQMRQDLYAPRLRNGRLDALAAAPCRSPAAPGDRAANHRAAQPRSYSRSPAVPGDCPRATMGDPGPGRA